MPRNIYSPSTCLCRFFPHTHKNFVHFPYFSHFPFSARFRISLKIASADIGCRGGFLSFIVKFLVHLTSKCVGIFVTITILVFQICFWASLNPDSSFFVLDSPSFQHYCAMKFILRSLLFSCQTYHREKYAKRIIQRISVLHTF